MIESATFTAVVGICSALFTPEYPVEDKMHKAQACQVFQEYCTQLVEVEHEEYGREKVKKGAK